MEEKSWYFHTVYSQLGFPGLYHSVEKQKIQSHLERVCQSWSLHLGNDYVI